MGLSSGKYNMKNGNRRTTIPSISLKRAKPKKEKKEILPKCIHHDLLSNDRDNFTIIWIDTEMHHHPSNIDMQIKLKNLARYLRIFDELDAFEHYIKQIDQKSREKLFVILSTPSAMRMIPDLHCLSSVKCIYIYGQEEIEEKTKRMLFKSYPKVKGVFSKCRCLISQISFDKTK